MEQNQRNRDWAEMDSEDGNRPAADATIAQPKPDFASQRSAADILADGDDDLETAYEPAGFGSTDGDQEAEGYSRPRGQFSTIGRSLVFKGELVAEEDLLIQGRVEGTIKHTATNLTIGPHGSVKADIDAQHVIVQGRVVGDIRASESVIVEPSAQVRGDIFAPRVGLREGAKFKGRIDMDFRAARDDASESESGVGRTKKSARSRRQSK